MEIIQVDYPKDEYYENEVLGEYDIENLEKLEADNIVYSYGNGEYEGSGFIVWNKGDKYYYDYLSHCSCNGPTENLQSTTHTREELLELLKTPTRDECAVLVINKMLEITDK